MRSALYLVLPTVLLSFGSGLGSSLWKSTATLDEPPSPRAVVDGRALAAPGLVESSTRDVAAQDTLIGLPFADERPLLGHRGDSARYRFQALGDQLLEVRLDRQPVAQGRSGDGAVHIDLFQVTGRGTESGAVRLTDFEIENDTLRIDLPEAGEYVLQLEPGLLVDVRVAVRVELGAVLRFPVRQHDVADIRSFYGDPRDGGSRPHEGVDVYAPRATPIVAVTDGRAVPGRDEHGGVVVRLNTPGVTYYYAHLERAAMDRAVSVQAGDVVGYIGNSGNAARTPPHLHFGVYRWGVGTRDPLPQLREWRFEKVEEPTATAGDIIVDAEAIMAASGTGRRFVETEGRLLWLAASSLPATRVAPVSASTQVVEVGAVGFARPGLTEHDPVAFDRGLVSEPHRLVDSCRYLDGPDACSSLRAFAF